MVLAFMAVGAVTTLAVVLIVVALVVYLVAVIVQLRKITGGLDEVDRPTSARSSRRARRSTTSSPRSTSSSTPASTCSRACSCKKAGMTDAVGLVDGLYPGAAAAGFRNFPESAHDQGAAHRRGLHAGHAHARAARPRGADRRRRTRPASRCGTSRAEASPRGCCTRSSGSRGRSRCRRSPVIGTDAPVQYEQRDDIGAPRKRLPARRS